ncbi:hypothetical protein [Primorskyibacter sp. 2E233]|uniref:hypothetical protein n=1 Tax=Primorskyibacter sp. 2E233 TaxID=3413431 RepID=UPI003BEFA5CD
MTEFTPFKKFHPATKDELARWSTFSRNTIGPCLSRLGVPPFGKRYPMIRVYSGMLGMTPADQAEEVLLGAGLVRTTHVAEMVGMSVDALHAELRRMANAYPPLFVFGSKRHLMLRAQVEQMLSSPRNAWHEMEIRAEHARPASRLARALGVSQARIDALLASNASPPAHVIAGGRTRYLVADVTARLAEGTSATRPALPPQNTSPDMETTGATPVAPAPTAGGLFSRAVSAISAGAPTAAGRTQSAPDARRGDRAHGVPPEAKLSDT